MFRARENLSMREITSAGGAATPNGACVFISEKDKLEGRGPQLDDPRAESYTPGPRITEADRTSSIKLYHRLYLGFESSRKPNNSQLPYVLASERSFTIRKCTTKARFGVLPRGASRLKVHIFACWCWYRLNINTFQISSLCSPRLVGAALAYSRPMYFVQVQRKYSHVQPLPTYRCGRPHRCRWHRGRRQLHPFRHCPTHGEQACGALV